MENNFIRLGQIQRPFGLKGEAHCYSLTSFPKERFKVGTSLTLFNEKKDERLTVTVASFHYENQEQFILGFKEINTPEDIGKFRNYFIEIDADLAPLPKGYFRLEDLKGCIVYDASNGNRLGEVVDVTQYSPTLNIVVKKEDGKRFYVPYVKGHFIEKADLENKEIRINVIEGLL